ncbi:MAG: 2-oxoacid:acceptor oxidoreductase family protein [Deltaproteobacteria bacterium]|nr:2-oxoacid:acceptor oxidoreductase family protein [Deltaproteobacteria bacterium]
MSAVVRHLRFHGRGGEGVKLASRIVSRAAFVAGWTVQDSPLYGAERRGAPVVAFVRCSDGPIHERGYIEMPDVVVLMDHSLLAHLDAAVLHGLGEDSLLLVNTAQPAEEIKAGYAVPGRVVTLDVSTIALDLLGHRWLSAPMAGLAVKATALAPWPTLAQAVAIELTEIGLDSEFVERNLRATQQAFEAAPAVGWAAAGKAPPPARASATALFVLPRLPARVAAPSIDAEATSALRTMDGWRVFRPVVDLTRCTRCFLCFALCPEGAIQLDSQHYPVIDYDHCKGCLVCVNECPPKAISEVREEAA